MRRVKRHAKLVFATLACICAPSLVVYLWWTSFCVTSPRNVAEIFGSTPLAQGMSDEPLYYVARDQPPTRLGPLQESQLYFLYSTRGQIAVGRVCGIQVAVADLADNQAGMRSIASSPFMFISRATRLLGGLLRYEHTTKYFVGSSNLLVLTFPHWLAFLVSAIPTITFAVLLRRARGRLRSGHCPSCNYNLTGNTSGICPECGTPIADKRVTPNTSPKARTSC
jgi:hypothetical protein